MGRDDSLWFMNSPKGIIGATVKNVDRKWGGQVKKNNEPTVSLIISTYNQPQILRLVLKTVFAQTRLPDEIVVADDGSGEETIEMIKEISSKAPVPLLHVWQPDEDYRLPASLNNAIAASSREYLIFLDGDCFLNRYFVEDHLSFAEPGRYVVGTRVNIRPARRDYILRTDDTDISIFSWGISKRAHAIRSRFLSRFRRRGGMAGANFSAWRCDLETINGFNERFNRHGGSDADLARRFEQAGIFRKKMAHLGMAYHFAHSAPENRGDSATRIKEVWDSTPEDERIRCRLGLNRALEEGVTLLNR